MEATHTDLIRAGCLGEVSHPFDTVIIAFLQDFQEAYVQPGSGEHENLKVDVDRRSRPWLPVGGRCKVRSCIQSTLRPTL